MAAVPVLKIESRQRALYGGCESGPLTRGASNRSKRHAAIGTYSIGLQAEDSNPVGSSQGIRGARPRIHALSPGTPISNR